MIDFIIGGDPEFPCKDKETGKYISLVPYVEGTKDNKTAIPVELCFQQIDNVAIEFETPPVKEFLTYYNIVQDCIKSTNTWLKKINKNWELDVISSARYEGEELQSDIAMQFGCEPSYSIYKKGISPRLSPEEVGNLRAFGYHLHFGFNQKLTKEQMKNFIILCDLFLGIPSMVLDISERNHIYGNIGDIRVKNASRVEYRVLGAGIHRYPEFVNKGIEMIKNWINSDSLPLLIEEVYPKLVEIDISDKKETSRLIKDLEKKLKKRNLWNIINII
jgi:hypothetical protein